MNAQTTRARSAPPPPSSYAYGSGVDALRKHDEIALAERDRFLTDRVSPAVAPRDEVVLDHTLRAGHHLRRDVA
jgi:hypothetical protein